MQSIAAIVIVLAMSQVSDSTQLPPSRHLGDVHKQIRDSTLLIHQPRTYDTVLATAKPITARFRNSTARDVLQFLARHANVEVRFVPGAALSTPITLNVREAALADVFDTVLKEAELEVMVLDDTTLLVSPQAPRRDRRPR